MIVGRITAARNPALFNTIALQNPQFNFVWIGDGIKSILSAQILVLQVGFKPKRSPSRT
jgi:hypothetical protein